MSVGDRVEIIDRESEYFGRFGHIDHVTSEGMVVVSLEGERGPLWLWTFHPFDLENASPITYWWMTHPDWIPARED